MSNTELIMSKKPSKIYDRSPNIGDLLLCRKPSNINSEKSGETPDGNPAQPKKKVRITINYDENAMQVAKFKTKGWKDKTENGISMHIVGIEQIPNSGHCSSNPMDGMENLK